MTDISFIIPCYRSENTIGKVIDEITGIADNDAGVSDYEIITVNDGSPDDVIGVLRSYAGKDRHIKVVDLAKNSGQHAAIMAGMKYAKFSIAVLLDDDGQCPVDRLEDLIAPLSAGYDVSIAQYGFDKRKESPFRVLGSRINDMMMQSLLGKPKNLGMFNFYAIKSFVVKEMLKYTNPYPYIDGLILRVTRNIAGVEMSDRKRIAGKSNYDMGKLLSLLMNGFTAFSIKPLRISTYIGMITAAIGFIYGLYIVIRKLLDSAAFNVGYSSLMAAILFVGGMIMIMLGLCGEYIGRIYISINSSPQYVVRKTYNIEE